MGQIDWFPVVTAALGIGMKVAWDEVQAIRQRRREKEAEANRLNREFFETMLQDTLGYVLAVFDAEEAAAAGDANVPAVPGRDYRNHMVDAIGDHEVIVQFVNLKSDWRGAKALSLERIEHVKDRVTMALQMQRALVVEGKPIKIPTVPVEPFSIPEGHFTPPALPGGTTSPGTSSD